MERSTSPQDEPEYSWSPKTTPASDDIEEIVQFTPLVPPRGPPGLRPRFMRGHVRRRRGVVLKGESDVEGCTRTSTPVFAFPVLELKRSVDGSDISTSSASLTIITSADSSCTGPWSSSSGFVEEEEDDDECWEREPVEDDQSWDDNQTSVEDMLVPKLEPEDDDVCFTDVKESSFIETPSVSSSPVVFKRPRGRPRKHPKLNPEDRAKIAKNRSKTGCITCRRRKKKCDEQKPGC
jgi:hypothetical protein